MYFFLNLYKCNKTSSRLNTTLPHKDTNKSSNLKQHHASLEFVRSLSVFLAQLRPLNQILRQHYLEREAHLDGMSALCAVC